jgi:hypothetical protein
VFDQAAFQRSAQIVRFEDIVSGPDGVAETVSKIVCHPVSGLGRAKVSDHPLMRANRWPSARAVMAHYPDWYQSFLSLVWDRFDLRSQYQRHGYWLP